MVGVMLSTLPIEFQAVFVAAADFLTTAKRGLGVLRLPFGQPGDFPRVFGGRAGLPIHAKIGRRLCCTRCGVNCDCVFCQGKGLSLTTSRPRKSCHCARLTSIVQRSQYSGFWKRGKVQWRYCLRKRMLGSTGHRC